jgi:exonuclease III
MKIGFWNIAGQNNPFVSDLIFDWSRAYDLDVIVLLECKIPEAALLFSLNREQVSCYFWSPSFFPDPYFSVYTKLIDKFSLPIKEDRRVQARNIIDPLYGNFSLVLVHYQSKLHWDDNDQNAHASELKYFIDELENQVEHDRTVVIGDFNMNPFQLGMIQTTGLHTTMDRRIAEWGSRVVDGKRYKFFYNPMWSFFGERGKGEINGTYFYNSSKPVSYFWNIFDQVILRPSLLDAFDEDSLEILNEINGQNLLTIHGRIDNTISDHLPVIFDLNLKNINYATMGKSLAGHAW